MEYSTIPPPLNFQCLSLQLGTAEHSRIFRKFHGKTFKIL